MIEPIEGIQNTKHVEDTQNTEYFEELTLQLTPRKKAAAESLKDNEEMVLESIKNGNCALVEVLLETGFDKDLLDIEREVYEVQKEMSLLDFEINICSRQREMLTEYTDNFHSSDDPKQLKNQLFSNLAKLIEDNTQEAVDKDVREEDLVKDQFRLFKAPDIDPLTIKAEYLQHFQQLNLNFDKVKISEIQESLKIKIEALRKKREGVLCSLDEIRLIKQEVDKVYFASNNDQLAIYQSLVKSPGTFKVPPKYTVDKETMESILQHKVSPNLVDPETGETLLHIALAKQHIEMVKLLISRGADPLKTNRNNISSTQIAGELKDPELLKALTDRLKKVDFTCSQLRQGYSELDKFLTELLEAKSILDTYADTLFSRLGLIKIIRIFLFIEKRLISRVKDFAVYYGALKVACEMHDPQIFFNEVLKRAQSAERGLREKSDLHDPLLILCAKFLKRFDSLAFNHAKEVLFIANAKNASSPVIKRQKEEIKTTKEENISLKLTVSKLCEDVTKLTARVDILQQAAQKTNRDSTPRRSVNEIKMTELPAKSLAASSFFSP